MFSFTNILNPFSPPAFADHDHDHDPDPDPDHDHIFLHQHQYYDPLSGPFVPMINGPILPSMTRQNNGDPVGGSNFVGKIPVKKDRHSKIYTSQGLRDRRVRLSIDIARKFFDLQDMLGFDKASTTLDWLLTKSRKEIEHVAQMKSLSSTSGIDEEIISNTSSFVSSHDVPNNKEKQIMKMPNEAATTHHENAKESRAKARARARERAREKMRTATPPTQLQVCEFEPFEESIVITRKLKPSGRLDYQPNGQNSNYFPNFPINWDITSTIARSSFCAIPNMNLSKGIIFRHRKLVRLNSINTPFGLVD